MEANVCSCDSEPPPDSASTLTWSWRDRISEIDPTRFGGELHESAGDSAIWLVMMTGYRGFDARCETIASVLATDRPQQTLIVGRTVFEPMFLHRFGPPR